MTLLPSKWPAGGSAAIALCAITLIAWANSFQSGFVFDNNFLLNKDMPIHEATFENLSLIVNHTFWWPFRESGLYRPLTMLSFLFNYAILGNADDPGGYHWINLLLHTGNVLLVFALARRLTGDMRLAFPIAAVWAVHPVLTESVTNIMGRADLLAGMTTVGGLLIYLRSTESSGWRKTAWLSGLTAVTAVGVFSKENAVAILGVVALYELLWWDKKRLPGLLWGCLAISPAVVAMLWVRFRVIAASAPAVFPFVDNPIVAADFWTGRLTAIKVMARYLGLLIWPAHLSADYSYPQIPLAAGLWNDWIAWLAMAGAALAVALLYRRNKTAFFAAGFAFITLLPTSNLLIPVGTIMAERFLYLPAVGFAVCLVLALDAIARRTRGGTLALVPVCLLITAGFGARTWVRNKDWRDAFTFWSVLVRTSPLDFKSHLGLAEQLLEPDHFDAVRARSEDEIGLAMLASLPDRLTPPGIYFEIAGQYVTMGDGLRRQDADGKLVTPPESIRTYERAKSLLIRRVSAVQAYRQNLLEKKQGLWGEHGDLKLVGTTGNVNTYLGLSEIDQRLGNAGESLYWAGEAQRLGPKLPAVYLRIHNVHLAEGRRDQAVAALIEGLLLTSDPGLERMLMQHYAEEPAESKCVVSYEGVTKIDFSCPVVRGQVCAVSSELIRLGMKPAELTAKYGCPASLP